MKGKFGDNAFGMRFKIWGRNVSYIKLYIHLQTAFVRHKDETPVNRDIRVLRSVSNWAR